MKIIGFAGVARAGKSVAATAAANYLLDNGFTPVMERFAGPLKDASDMVGMRKGGDTDSMYRRFCQHVGTLAREASPDWWVNLLMQRARDVSAAECADLVANPNNGWHERVLIIDDVRYENEVECIRRMGGKVVFISAARRLGAWEMQAKWRSHASEALANGYEDGQFDDQLFDFTVSNNDGTDEGLALFISTIGPLAYKIVTSAREEIR